jgi:DNA-binding NarL/FixJ family response regulator
MTTRIVLVDDHPVLLAGIKALLQSEPDLDVVGVAHTGAAGLTLVQSMCPDLAMIDVSMADMSGIDLARQIARERPDVKVVVLTLHEEAAYLDQMVEAGVRGYVLKRSAAEDLLRAIRAVLAGGVYIDPAMAAKAFKAMKRADPATEPTEREAGVLQRVAQGLSNKEIAQRLCLSVKTVETYKARAMHKLDLHSRAEIVRYAADRGWLNRL